MKSFNKTDLNQKTAHTMGGIFNVVAFAFTVLGLILAVVFYFKANKERVPVFLGNGQGIVIARSTAVLRPPFKVVRSNGTEIPGDIYATTLFFYNAGKLSIKPENVLSPLKILIEDKAAEILDLRIAKTSRDIVAPKVLRSKTDSLRSFDVDFRILEEEDGFSLNAIYVGDPNSKFRLAGLVEGTKGEISSHKIENIYFWRYFWSNIKSAWWLFAIMIVSFVGLVKMARKLQDPTIAVLALITLVITLVLPPVSIAYDAYKNNKAELKSYISRNLPTDIIP